MVKDSSPGDSLPRRCASFKIPKLTTKGEPSPYFDSPSALPLALTEYLRSRNISVEPSTDYSFGYVVLTCQLERPVAVLTVSGIYSDQNWWHFEIVYTQSFLRRLLSGQIRRSKTQEYEAWQRMHSLIQEFLKGVDATDVKWLTVAEARSEAQSVRSRRSKLR